MPGNDGPFLWQSFRDLTDIGAAEQHESSQQGNPCRFLQRTEESGVQHGNRCFNSFLAGFGVRIHAGNYMCILMHMYTGGLWT